MHCEILQQAPHETRDSLNCASYCIDGLVLQDAAGACGVPEQERAAAQGGRQLQRGQPPRAAGAWRGLADTGRICLQGEPSLAWLVLLCMHT